jgi:putative ABC transport system permease protein
VRLWESILVAFEAIAANRLRSGLTMLGLIFGVGAVIAAVSLTEGAKVATLKRFEAMGTNTITIRPGQNERGPVGGGMGSQATLTMDDAYAIAGQVPEVVQVAPQVQGRAQVVGNGNNTSTQIIGTTSASEQAESYNMQEGSFLSETDVARARKVAVIGPTVGSTLFGTGSKVVGESIRIGGRTFRVIGMYAPKGSMGFRDPNDQVLIPVTTAIRRGIGVSPSAQGKETVGSIVLQVQDMSQSEAAQKAVTGLLRDRHGLKTGMGDDFRIMSVADVVQGATEANKLMTVLFSSIAAVSLVVGGIGIMNIMLVSVTERTREIGLRKAVGATPKDIMTQFLIEALTLSTSGGLVGVAAGIGTVPIVAKLGLSAQIPVEWVFIAFSFAAAVGIVFGLLPARKAASLAPVEALRYE